MPAFDTLQDLTTLAQLVGLSSVRLAVAFLILPIFSQETLPSMVRNAFFVGLAIVSLALQGPVDLRSWGATQWVGVFLKEAWLGLALGFTLAAVLWAFEAAGQIVDTHAGATQAQLTDPHAGQQTSLSGLWMGRLSHYIFMAGGGFTLWIAALLESYAQWPVASFAWRPSGRGVELFTHDWGRLAETMLMLAGPAIVLLFMVDVLMGLANRLAPQLSVLSMSMSLKLVAAALVWLLMLSQLVDIIQHRTQDAVRRVIPAAHKVIEDTPAPSAVPPARR